MNFIAANVRKAFKEEKSVDLIEIHREQIDRERKIAIIKKKKSEADKVVANNIIKYNEEVEKDPEKPTGDILNELIMNRMCCRRMFIGQIDMVDKI